MGTSSLALGGCGLYVCNVSMIDTRIQDPMSKENRPNERMNEIQRKTKIQRPKRNQRTTILEKTNKIQNILKNQDGANRSKLIQPEIQNPRFIQILRTSHLKICTY
jgi:hypothetical protein